MTGTAEAPRPVAGGQAERENRGRQGAHVQLTLLRHGEPDWRPADGRVVKDAGLTVFGAAQARAAAGAIAREPVDAIYVSPLRRSQQTAAPLAEATGVEPITVDGLAEIGVEIPNLSQAEVDTFFVAAMQRPLSELWEGYPGGESFRDFHGRVTRTLEEILSRHELKPERTEEFTVWDTPARRQHLVIVAHGGTNGVLLTHLLDVSPVPWEWLRFETELAAYSVVRARPIGDRGCVWSLRNFNEIDPLREAGLR